MSAALHVLHIIGVVASIGTVVGYGVLAVLDMIWPERRR